MQRMRRLLDCRLRGRSIAVRLAIDIAVVAAFKARFGWRWKLAINAALKDWLKTHSPA